MAGIIIGIVVAIIIIIVLILSICPVRPTSRGLIGRFGRYIRFTNPGIVFLMPFIEHLVRINITENIIDAGLHEIITGDSLNPTADVRETMNKVVKANNERVAPIDLATAPEMQADDERRAATKVAEGQRQAAILEADGQNPAKILVVGSEAQAIKLVNETAISGEGGNSPRYSRK
jgi:regulator of protease activity HflC (stomatin/prohibitin superfamily)